MGEQIRGALGKYFKIPSGRAVSRNIGGFPAEGDFAKRVRPQDSWHLLLVPSEQS